MKNLKMEIFWPQIREFCACIFYCLSYSVLQRKRWKCAIKSRPKSCRKGLTALQRGARCMTAGPLSQCNNDPVATQ